MTKSLRTWGTVSIALFIAIAAICFTFFPRTLATHAAQRTVSTSLFTLEHQHGVTKSGVSPNSVFSFNCTAQGAVKGNLLISVSENVVNDADSGQAGDYWALDKIARTIRVWNTGPDQYCAIVNYVTDHFVAIQGQQSPGGINGNGGLLTGDEVGAFTGSSQFLITGQLYLSNPTQWPASGPVNSGTAIDYQCNSSGNCPGYVDWITQYFGANTFTEPQWGFRYVGVDGGPIHPKDKGTADGVWVNAYTGNSGDILDVD